MQTPGETRRGKDDVCFPPSVEKLARIFFLLPLWEKVARTPVRDG
jgi:hypothetical protein